MPVTNQPAHLRRASGSIGAALVRRSNHQGEQQVLPARRRARVTTRSSGSTGPGRSGSDSRLSCQRPSSVRRSRGMRCARRLGPDQVEDASPQLLLGQVALDPAAHDQADRAGLLADHDHDRIGLLADADRRPMARPVALAVEHILRERQQHGGRHDLVAGDDHRAVVQRRAAVEDRGQQLGAQVGMDRHARVVGQVLQARVALQHDQGAVPRAGQQPRRAADLAGHALGRRRRRSRRRIG